MWSKKLRKSSLTGSCPWWMLSLNQQSSMPCKPKVHDVTNQSFHRDFSMFKFLKTFHVHLSYTSRISPLHYPDSKVHLANVGPTWVLSAPDGTHVGPMNLAIRVYNNWVRRLTAIIRATNMVPCSVVKSLHIISSSGTRRLHLRVPDLQLSRNDWN